MRPFFSDYLNPYCYMWKKTYSSLCAPPEGDPNGEWGDYKCTFLGSRETALWEMLPGTATISHLAQTGWPKQGTLPLQASIHPSTEQENTSSDSPCKYLVLRRCQLFSAAVKHRERFTSGFTVSCAAAPLSSRPACGCGRAKNKKAVQDLWCSPERQAGSQRVWRRLMWAQIPAQGPEDKWGNV